MGRSAQSAVVERKVWVDTSHLRVDRTFGAYGWFDDPNHRIYRGHNFDRNGQVWRRQYSDTDTWVKSGYVGSQLVERAAASPVEARLQAVVGNLIFGELAGFSMSQLGIFRAAFHSSEGRSLPGRTTFVYQALDAWLASERVQQQVTAIVALVKEDADLP